MHQPQSKYSVLSSGFASLPRRSLLNSENSELDCVKNSTRPCCGSEHCCQLSANCSAVEGQNSEIMYNYTKKFGSHGKTLLGKLLLKEKREGNQSTREVSHIR